VTDFSVLHIIDSLEPGGTERQCLELARGLAGAGVRTAVLCFRTGPLLEEFEGAGVAISTVELASVRSGRLPARLLRLVRAIRAHRPDVVQTYGFYSNVPGILSASLARVPVRVSGRRELGQYLGAAQRRADRLVGRLAHRVAANSEAVRRHLIAHEGVPPGKVVVIRNGLDMQYWSGVDHGENDQRDAIVGMVARFREQKDHATFLDSAVEVLKIIPSARFCLVGSGPLEEPVREHARRLGIADRVEFAGALAGQDLRAAMTRFSVSVLTSKDNEGLPNVVLESMALGQPVVATAVGGTSEVVQDGVTGFLVAPGRPAQVAERIAALLKDPSLARTMGERGRQRIEREFTLDRMVAGFHGMYRELLERVD
jgi:glycosyltransferase involved in cell wall biosynthesis